MIGILYGKIKQLMRTPWTMLLMIALTIGFVFAMGMGNFQERSIPVFAEKEDIKHSEIGKSMDKLDVVSIQWVSKETLHQKVEAESTPFGIILKENSFQLIKDMDSPYEALVYQLLTDMYEKKATEQELLTLTSGEKREALETALHHKERASPFLISYEKEGEEKEWFYDEQLHQIFGMTLFFVIYTIANSVVQILVEKQTGLWDRVILSPVKKTEMYIGNFLYSFSIGLLQVVFIFLIFQYVFDVNFYNQFGSILLLVIPYIFAIVSLSFLIAALTRTIQQYNALMPFIAIALAMIGGAYWPLEVVESKGMQVLANISPVKYAMEILNGVTLYDKSFSELLQPMMILTFTGILLGGISIHLMEKRHM